MSHARDQRIELRAVFAIAAVCALVFGLLTSGAYASRAETGMRVSVISDDVGRAFCHHSADISQDGTPDNGGRAKTGCPCCLAAYVAAVLPERSPASLRVERTATRALYLAPADAAPRSPEFHHVNGARAPPRSSTIS